MAAGARLRAQEIASLEIFDRYIKKDGSDVWVHKRVSMLHDVTGKPIHHVALVTDMTFPRPEKCRETALRSRAPLPRAAPPRPACALW